MKKFAVKSYVTATQIAGLRHTFEEAGFSVDLSADLPYIVIDNEAKTVVTSDDAEGDRIWSPADATSMIQVEAPVETPEPVAEPASAHVHIAYATADEIDQIRTALDEAGYTLSGNNSAPFVNFYPESKEAKYATIAVGSRLMSAGAVADFCGISLPEPEEAVMEEAELDFALDDVEEIEADEIMDTLDFVDDDEPEVIVIEKDAEYKTSALAKGEGFSLHVLTNDEMSISVDADEASANIG